MVEKVEWGARAAEVVRFQRGVNEEATLFVLMMLGTVAVR